jgi:hypothetical protein
MDDVFSTIERMIAATETRNERQMLEKSGFSTGAGANWKKRGRVPDGALAKVSQMSGRSVEWLRTGSGDIYLTPRASDPRLETAVRETESEWRRPGEPQSDFEQRIVGMLRRISPQARQNLLNMITTVYFNEMERREEERGRE